MRKWLHRFAMWRDRRLRFRADWWRDVARWTVMGGPLRRIREQRQAMFDDPDRAHRRR